VNQNQPVLGVAAPDLEVCERELIQTPGSIQPHGLLLVVDLASDRILQVAGDAAARLDYAGALDGGTVREALGRSLEDLVFQSETVLTREPVFLGTVRPVGDREELIILAHLVERAAVVELMPLGRLGSAAQALSTIRSTSERIGGASSLVEASDLAAAEIRRITGYDRVLVYQFLQDNSGTVIAEANHGQLPLLLNHRFPASDIPAQARDLYRRNPIRIIPDVGYSPSPLAPITHRPLDMSHCVLRSVSPVHIQYLKNMNVAASMSVSLLPREKLWGLIACHNTTAKMLPYEALEACRHVAQILSLKIQASEDSDCHRQEAELSAVRDRVMSLLFATDDPGVALLKLGPELKEIVPSHGMAVSWKGTVVVTGTGPTEPQVRDLTACLERRMSAIGLFATDHLSEEFPDAAAFAPEASGLLCLHLSGDYPVMLMWFRPEQVEEITWAGNPHEPLEAGEVFGELNPRRSFQTWRETVRNRSRTWSAVEIDAVERFGASVAFVLQQGRIRELERIKEQYMATVGHELRTPVTSMKGSLDILVAGTAGIVPDSMMHLLEMAQRNCQRLICLTNDFLDLERIGSGRMVFDLKPVEVRALVEEEIKSIQGFATPYDVRVHLDASAVQTVARADSIRLAQAVTNLLSNAVKVSPRGAEVVVGIENWNNMIRIWVRDNGPGIPDEFKARIFQKFAQVDTPEARERGGTGLGLNIVKEIVERHNGEVGFEPGPGGGTIFYITLPHWEAATGNSIEAAMDDRWKL
jgi:light-regulated signal transduction histidine kinase (bacteriophytochrome)